MSQAQMQQQQQQQKMKRPFRQPGQQQKATAQHQHQHQHQHQQHQKPKLFYFDFRGRAELCRLVLTAANVEFDDIRFTREQWTKQFKSQSPSSHCPFVRLPDGRQLTQSGAIARYFAREAKLYGDTNWEMFLCDEAIQQVEDIEMEFSKFLMVPEEQREVAMEAAAAGAASQVAKALERTLASTGYVAGSSVTIGDLAVIKMVDMLLRFPTFHLPKEQHQRLSDIASRFLDAHAGLLEHRERVLRACPAVANYMRARPVTPTY